MGDVCVCVFCDNSGKTKLVIQIVIQIVMHFPMKIHNVLLAKIDGPVWYTIYHQLPVDKGFVKPLFFHQPTNGKRTSMIHD